MLKIHKKLIIGLAFVGGVALILYLSKQISIPKMESGGGVAPPTPPPIPSASAAPSPAPAPPIVNQPPMPI
ncbi:MAG: hypothetical protein KA974_10255 [Saprospiraceae bacterium]|nr:hypothetical protein [Saprospiraceae bacterium]